MEFLTTLLDIFGPFLINMMPSVVHFHRKNTLDEQWYRWAQISVTPSQKMEVLGTKELGNKDDL